MEASIKDSAKVTFVEEFISSISFMKAITDVSMKTSVEVTSMKASITSAKAPVTSMKASMEDFVEVTSMEVFMEAFVKLPWKLLPWKLIYLLYLPWKLPRKISWKLPWNLLPSKLT